MLKRIIYYTILSMGLLLMAGCGQRESEQRESEQTVASVLEDTVSQSVIEAAEEVPEEDEEIVADSPSGQEVTVPAPEAVETFTKAERLESIKVKGIYVTGPVAGSSRMDELITLLDETELNTMVIDVKNDDGNITFEMDNKTVEEIGATVKYIQDIEALMTKLKEHNIYTIARIVCFKDPKLAAGKGDLALLKPDGQPVTDGNGLAWVNPYREEVWNYLAEIAEGAIAAGFDEVQYDYVRFPIGVEAEYGVNTEEYTKEQALTNYFAFMENRMSEKDIIFGADLFGTVIGSDIDTANTGQNYTTIASYADNVCPMVYPSHYGNGVFNLSVPDAYPYETVKGAMTKSAEALSGLEDTEKAKVRPWLQCFTATWVEGHISYDGAALRKQIDAVYDSGYDQWILWNASNRYDITDGLEAETPQ